jgi:hypothetical protein
MRAKSYLGGVVIALLLLCIPTQAKILWEATDSRTGHEINTESEDGGSVSTVTSPTRGGSHSFRHSLPNSGGRAEIKTKTTDIGGTYWYGVSFFIPNAFVSNPYTVITQYGAFPSVHPHPCGGIGSKMSLREGKLFMDLQHAGDSSESVCDKFAILDISSMKNKWTDIVMHAKWTGNKDGFVKVWTRIDGGAWSLKIDYKGRTFWNDEGAGPNFKWGGYSGGGSNRVLYSDEMRIGDADSCFNEVAPGIQTSCGGGGTPTVTPTPSPTPTVSPTPNPPGCNSANGGTSWINNSFVNQTGTFTATFDATPSTSPANMHVGLSSGAQTAYTGFAAIIRFNTSGNIDARNGGAYSAASTIPYSANTKYSFRVVVNVPAHTYSVYVTPAGGSEVAVGENFAFRTEQATVSQLNNYGSYVEGSSGSLQVCNFQIGGGGGTTTLINEDCSSLANFTKVSGGTWGVNSSGQCTLTAAATCASPLCNILTHNTSVSGDFTLTAEGAAAASSNAWDDFAIVFGYVDASNYYYASFNEGDDAGTNGIFRVQAGAKTQIVDFGSNVTAPGTTLHAIKIVKTGTTINVYKGSALIGTLSSASIGSGKVGFGAYNNNASFDNLKIVQN